MDVWLSDTRRVAVVALEGELDLVSCDALRRALLEATVAERLVVLDFAQVTFIDSSAVGVIVGAHRRLQGRGARLGVVNASRDPRRVLGILGLGWLLADAECANDSRPPATGRRSRRQLRRSQWPRATQAS